MKNLNKALVALLIGGVSVVALDSCKKGEEDPFLSLRTRDSRMTGTWELKSVAEEVNVATTTKTTNNVNADTEDETSTVVTTRTFDGTTWTEATKTNSTTTEKNKEYNFTTNSYVDNSDETKVDRSETNVWATTVKVQIFEDGTYRETTTMDRKSHDIRNTTTFNGTGTINNDDSTYTSAPQTTITDGTWTWSDSKKNKMIISAGSLSGKILRLANDELIISEITEDSDDDTDLMTNSFPTYSTTSPTSKDGVQTEKSVTATKTTSNWTWSKLDNEDERAGE